MQRLRVRFSATIKSLRAHATAEVTVTLDQRVGSAREVFTASGVRRQLRDLHFKRETERRRGKKEKEREGGREGGKRGGREGGRER